MLLIVIINIFIEEFASLRICLLHYLFCRNLAKHVIFVVFTLLSKWSPWAIHTAHK